MAKLETSLHTQLISPFDDLNQQTSSTPSGTLRIATSISVILMQTLNGFSKLYHDINQ